MSCRFREKGESVLQYLGFTIPLAPVTKKNSQRIILIGGRPRIIPSKKYEEYEKDCAFFMPKVDAPISCPVNLKAVYYMPARRRVDLVNLLEATADVLVHYGILEDDNSNIIVSTDGSRVLYDKESPRTEIEITEV